MWGAGWGVCLYRERESLSEEGGGEHLMGGGWVYLYGGWVLNGGTIIWGCDYRGWMLKRGVFNPRGCVYIGGEHLMEGWWGGWVCLYRGWTFKGDVPVSVWEAYLTRGWMYK